MNLKKGARWNRAHYGGNKPQPWKKELPVDKGQQMKFSVIVPAYNEEKYIGECLESIRAAAGRISDPVEIVVVVNRCTDATESIAKSYGSIVVAENERNLSKIRNAGVAGSSGGVIVTIDADSRMSDNLFVEIKKRVESAACIGGGAALKAERVSPGILLSCLFFLAPVIVRHGISMGLYWCRREDFVAIGGFDEKLLTGEDIDFAIRLKNYGKTMRKRYKIITSAHIVTSCRKWDLNGDWYLFKHLKMIGKIYKGKRTELTDKWWYEAGR
jgi:glycosyltransferase involved in cell wall biosynthesis